MAALAAAVLTSVTALASAWAIFCSAPGAALHELGQAVVRLLGHALGLLARGRHDGVRLAVGGPGRAV